MHQSAYQIVEAVAVGDGVDGFDFFIVAGLQLIRPSLAQ